MKVGTDGVLLGAWANAGDSPTPAVLDIGTGTGIVALMMAQRFPTATVTAIDIDTDAAEQASLNAKASPFADRIAVYHTALQEVVEQIDISSNNRESSKPYTAIVCNPPYFYDSLTCPDSQRTTARHAVSLTARDIATASATLLGDGGELSVILPYDQHSRMESEAVFTGLFLKRLCAVKTSKRKPPSRILMAFANSQCTALEQTTLTIGDEIYRQMTAPFYLD